MQSRLMSATEVSCNIGTGVLVSWVVTIYLIPWMLGVEMTVKMALDITLIYTAVSMVRSYIWRRIFNR